jgi:hypothetical protein
MAPNSVNRLALTPVLFVSITQRFTQ